MRFGESILAGVILFSVFVIPGKRAEHYNLPSAANNTVLLHDQSLQLDDRVTAEQ